MRGKVEDIWPDDGQLLRRRIGQPGAEVERLLAPRGQLAKDIKEKPARVHALAALAPELLDEDERIQALHEALKLCGESRCMASRTTPTVSTLRVSKRRYLSWTRCT